MRFSEIAGETGIFVDGDWIEKKDQDAKGAVRLIQLADVGPGEFRDKSDRHITVEKADELHCTFLRKGDILIARLGDPLCKACVFPLDGLYITAVDVAILRIGSDVVNPKYLIYLLNSPWFKDQVKQYESGTTRKRISRKNLDRIEMIFPPLPEQQRIVARIEELFSQLDAGVEMLKKTKAQLAVYRQAVLKEAFSCCAEKKPIREMSSIVTSGSRGWAKYYCDNGAKFIRIGNLTRNKIYIDLDDIQHVQLPDKAEGTRTKLAPNDVLVSITADLGSIGLVPNGIGEAYVNQHIAMIRFNNQMQGEFYAWYLRSEYGQQDLLRNKRGGGKLGLGLDDIRDSRVPVVSNETAESILSIIECRLSVCDSIEHTVDLALQQAEAMRQSILKDAFEGRL
ncbi:restriction endonuclease subunit S [Vescimonas sp.]|uniref:restriction endonuclease subunit S n=1 Tax=Vescimonas sp. TaxID=2892404 RepID=UPI003076EA68